LRNLLARASHYDALVRSLLAAFAFTLVGCSGADFSTVYDVTHGAFEGGGGTTIGATGDNASMDAAHCAVQGRASVTGSFSGTAFAPKDAVELFEAESAKFVINVVDYANACSLGANLHAGSSVVSIEYTGDPLSSGTFDVTKTEGLSVKYVEYDSTCKPAKSAPAATGSITFDKADECGAKGSFDLTFGTDHVTATFTASVCSVAGGAQACH
jgi:hypothetical protein